MADGLGIKLGVEGEHEFKQVLWDINKQFQVLGSEMKLATSSFDTNERSVESLTAKNEVLTKQIETQKGKIETLSKALENASNSFGENDRRTQEWAIKLNNAQAELNGMEREVKANTTAIYTMSREMDESGKTLTKPGGLMDSFRSLKEGFTSGGGLDGALNAITSGAGTAAVAVGAIGAAGVAAAVEVGKAYAGLEQALGGSVAVFGQYAEEIQAAGAQAYYNLGLSQAQYLETANKMGALFQGSGVEQQRSLELTTQAMQRAADMASVMGVDMQTAMNAVAGAAKGNFTMMDNLGVSMSATSIQAYAAANSLNFVWESATQAEKAEIAMQMFFDNTSQYAGNFAKEASSTLSGSIGMLEAAWQSFVAGIGNAEADLGQLSSNLIDAFMHVADNVVPLLENVIAALPQIIASLIVRIIPELIPLGFNLAKAIIEGIITGFAELLPSLESVVRSMCEKMPEWAKQALGINSPSKVFAGIGKNMGLGISTGFTDAMSDVKKVMHTAIPTDIDANLRASVGDGAKGAQSGGSALLSIPVVIDGRTAANAVARVLWDDNAGTVRVEGVA